MNFPYFKNLKLSYLPPLMIYFAAGISGFTAVVESFFIKDRLALSAAALAGLAFWVGLPYAFKMPIGQLVDIFWKWKAVFVFLGASLMMASLLVMVGLTSEAAWMQQYMAPEQWYILASLLAPIGFALQDVVADAMTVEAVPAADEKGNLYPEEEQKKMHITMQTLGRVAIIGGGALVAGASGWLVNIFSYQTMYELALVLPVISVMGVVLHAWIKQRRRKKLLSAGLGQAEIAAATRKKIEPTKPDWQILAGSAGLVAFIIVIGFSGWPIKEELVMVATLLIVIFFMQQLLKSMDQTKRKEIMAIAIIIFVFRAMPTTGAGATWWQIDVLGFDEPFFGTLQQISAILAIVGMLLLKTWMTKHSLPYIVVALTILGTVLSLPVLGMYYGLHEWTQIHFGFGARTIAMIDMAAVSPLGQVAMIPMLAWIAEKSPLQQKATYFAVFSAFTNLALSASTLLTKYINQFFLIERGDYTQLGTLMITVILIGLLLPIVTAIILWPKSQKKKAAGKRCASGSSH